MSTTKPDAEAIDFVSYNIKVRFRDFFRTASELAGLVPSPISSVLLSVDGRVPQSSGVASCLEPNGDWYCGDTDPCRRLRHISDINYSQQKA
jgi:hypothetical protein